MYEYVGGANDFSQFKVRINKSNHTYVIWEATNNGLHGGSGFGEYELHQKGTFDGDISDAKIQLHAENFELGNFSSMSELSEYGVRISGQGPGSYYCRILSEESCNNDPLFTASY